MATYRTIDQYRDPEKLSIADTLGKATTYRQQQYDTNIMQTQQLINQYVGTDLLRDVDKEYLGERLNTLVDYINQSGTRDWTRKNVAAEVQNYISTAIDSNVMSAIGSTQAYRKQMAQIEDIKKNKPELYAMQNEWFATKDLQRYISSNQVGDTYHAQSYNPYVNVKDAILKNADKLKEYGVEYVPANLGSVDSNGYFRMIGTKEQLSPETARQYLGAILGTSEMNQLYIDGQYSYKDKTADQVKTEYGSKLDSYVGIYDERIAEQKVLLGSATGTDKAKYQSNIDNLEAQKNQVLKQKDTDLSKEAMASYLYQNDYIDKWTNFLSYSRIKDWKIDDSMFKVQQEINKTNQFNAKMEFDQLQAIEQGKRDQAKIDLDKQRLQLEKDKFAVQKAGGLGTVGGAGNTTGTGSFKTMGGVTPTDSKDPLGDVKTPDLLKNQEQTFYNNFQDITEQVRKELTVLLSDPDNKSLSTHYDPRYANVAAGVLINTPSQSRDLYRMLSPELQAKIDTAQAHKRALKDVDTNLAGIAQDAIALGRAAMSPETKSSTKDNLFRASSFGWTIDNNGNVVKGDVLKGTSKFQDAARVMAYANNVKQSGDLTDEQEAALDRMVKNEMVKSGMSASQVSKALNTMKYQRTKEQLGDTIVRYGVSNPLVGGVIYGVLGAGQELYNLFQKDSPTQKADFADRFLKYSKEIYNSGQNESAINFAARRLGEAFKFNENIYSLGDHDVDPKKLAFGASTMPSRMEKQLGEVARKTNEAQNTLFNKIYNIDLGDKDAAATMLGTLKAGLPVGTEIQANSNVQLVLDPATGNSTAIVAVKDGKTFVPVPVSIPMKDLPARFLAGVDLQNHDRVYDATSKYAQGYSNRVGLPATNEDWYEQQSRLPASQRTQALAQTPVTQQTILEDLVNNYGIDKVRAAYPEIQKIFEKPIEVKLVAEQGQWTTVVSQNGIEMKRQPLGVQHYNPTSVDSGVPALLNEYMTERAVQAMRNIELKTASPQIQSLLQ